MKRLLTPMLLASALAPSAAMAAFLVVGGPPVNEQEKKLPANLVALGSPMTPAMTQVVAQQTLVQPAEAESKSKVSITETVEKKPEPVVVVEEVLTPTAQPAPAQVKPAALAKSWEVQLKDINLAKTLQRWAADAGWRVRWDAQKHFLVEAPDVIVGTFEEAVTALLESPGISTSSYPLEVCFYPNTPPLARVTRQGDQDKECL